MPTAGMCVSRPVALFAFIDCLSLRSADLVCIRRLLALCVLLAVLPTLIMDFLLCVSEKFSRLGKNSEFFPKVSDIRN